MLQGSSRRALALLTLTLPLGACAGALGGALVDVALDVARKTFLGVATTNYGDDYKNDFEKLLGALTQPLQPKDSGAAASSGATDGGSQAAYQDPGAPQVIVQQAPPPPPPLELEVLLLKEEIVGGRSIAVPVQDGEVLYDRFGVNGRGDNVKLAFRASESCWVYVVGIDGTGWASALFPSSYSAHSNPVSAGRRYEIPEGRAWVTLDSYRGVEHLYFLASRSPRPDLEEALRTIAANVRETDATRAEPELLAQVASPAPIARGFDTVRLSEVEGIATQDGELHTVQADLFLASRTADEVVVTRWFRHQ